MVAKFNHAEMEAYQSSLKIFRNNHNIYKSNIERAMEDGEEIGIKKGEKLGIEKGEKIGIEKGEKIGIEKGREEVKGEEKNEIALRLIAEGLDNDFIHRITGLSIKEIERLRKM
ncbi:MAG: hypothetical protein ACK5IQ_02900 [Bacteroidales bacterium]